MRTKISFALFLILALSSCQSFQQNLEGPVIPDGICVAVSAPDFESEGRSKSTISTSGNFGWTAGDKIGIFPNLIEEGSQTESQLALTLSAGEGTSAAYSSMVGWHLMADGSCNYFSCYPYSGSNSRDKINIDYTGQVQTANNSTAGLGAFDYMYSDMTEAESESTASFNFHHIGSLVNVNITVPEGYENTTFYSMRLYADSDVFAATATYSLNDIVASGRPSPEREMCGGLTLSFGDSGIKPSESVISAWMMMLPAQWKDKTITAKLYAHRNCIPTLSGTFTPDANQTDGVKYEYDVTSSDTGQTLPDKPAAGEQLHILLFGHSFGVDCTEYLPAITKAAGITDVHFGRWLQGNCSLASHWKHITAKDTYSYYDSNYKTGSWNSSSSRSVDDVLAQYPWDIILFQQSIGFDGEGKYSSYQPHLNYLAQYVTDYCESIHGKTPVIGWNMFWGYNNDSSTAYDIGTKGALAMYNAIVQATKDMMADNTKATEINLIVPSGTAIQNARGTSLNDPGSAESPSTTQLLTRDGYHASYGIGRYTAACTWFQYLIAPIYGVSIEGNTYRPTTKSFDKDLVTDERAAICQKCAIEAVKHPFEVTHIEE